MPKFAFKYRLPSDIEADEREGLAAATACLDESLTQQQFAQDCDLNVLALRFGLTGKPLPVEALDPSYYGDVSDVPDLRTVLDLANDAKNKFMDLPARIRSRFDNQPAKLWAFVNDPENADEAVRLGILQQIPNPTEPVGNTPPVEGGEGHIVS